ncbi:TetR/AcrR family transcriptional regulator [Protaetiibacter larvae]|uniref:TetR/AcrR family transcriptional regulator n=1 Tax=Protaetiibacter larvae TaxID=2592654 RepID=A0A5C1Y9K5_9MICO|nr:TetR/AcrR family transcriptional regulator [Protaetiibacter larvae]QEO09587.1 TetR/AcrR family transcriptional regulator [Protaetiibacter larvae]
MQLPAGFAVVRERARPLPPDDRREAILDAVLPVLRERGRDVTSRELAEAAGVAEGTIFRAFGDKDSLLDAGLQRLLDPAPFRGELRRIPHDLPFEDKLAVIIEALRVRFGDVFQIMRLFQVEGPPPRRAQAGEDWLEIVRELLEPDAARLGVPIDTVAWYLRLVAFGASIEPFNHFRPFDSAELATVIAHGVAVAPR